MAREKVDNKLNVVIGTKAQVEADNTIPDNSIVIVTDEELKANEIVYDDDKNVEEAIYERTNMVNVTYQELKDLRDNEELVSGTFYRITDYETTTVQVETRSAGHLFDVIVQALDEKTLSENAQAIQSARDVSGYFDDADLGGWKLKYTLENDRLKHYWADPVNGKGVIYQMIDEWGNDLPYDFKNIQFKRYKIETYAINTAFENLYYALKDLVFGAVPSGATIDDNDFIWAYTFTTKIGSDNTYIETTTLNKYILKNDNGVSPYCEKNVFGGRSNYMSDLLDEYNSYTLGNNVIYSSLYEVDEENPMLMYDFPNFNTIGNSFSGNTIGNSFYGNTIGNGVSGNTIGNGFNSNTVGNDFYSNTIDNYFALNTIGNNFRSNTIGNHINFNTIGNAFYNNTIGNYFESNTIGESIKYIQFSVDGNSPSIIRNLYIKSGLEGASSTNMLDLYYSGLYHRLYPTTIERIANGNIVSIHQETPLVWTGKKKTSNTSSTWEDI